MSSSKLKHSLGNGFVSRWTIANLVGLAVGFALWGILHDTWGEQSAGQNVLVSLMGELLVGTIAGTLQWIVVRHYISNMHWGIVGGSIGCAIGLIAGFFLGGVPFDFILGFIGFGLGSGLGQWLNLRHLIGGSWRWILASSLGYGIAGIIAVIAAIALGDAVDAAFGSGTTGFAAVLTMLGSIGGVVGGLITATSLVYLLRQTTPEEELAVTT